MILDSKGNITRKKIPINDVLARARKERIKDPIKELIRWKDIGAVKMDKKFVYAPIYL